MPATTYDEAALTMELPGRPPVEVLVEKPLPLDSAWEAVPMSVELPPDAFVASLSVIEWTEHGYIAAGVYQAPPFGGFGIWSSTTGAEWDLELYEAGRPRALRGLSVAVVGDAIVVTANDLEEDGPSVLFVSPDGGESWDEVIGPPDPVESVVVAGDVLVVKSRSSRAFRSAERGVWIPLGVGGEPVIRIVSDGSVLWAEVLSDEDPVETTVLVSLDGGQEFEPVTTLSLGYSLVAADGMLFMVPDVSHGEAHGELVSRAIALRPDGSQSGVEDRGQWGDGGVTLSEAVRGRDRTYVQFSRVRRSHLLYCFEDPDSCQTGEWGIAVFDGNEWADLEVQIPQGARRLVVGDDGSALLWGAFAKVAGARLPLGGYRWAGPGEPPTIDPPDYPPPPDYGIDLHHPAAPFPIGQWRLAEIDVEYPNLTVGCLSFVAPSRIDLRSALPTRTRAWSEVQQTLLMALAQRVADGRIEISTPDHGVIAELHATSIFRSRDPCLPGEDVLPPIDPALTTDRFRNAPPASFEDTGIVTMDRDIDAIFGGHVYLNGPDGPMLIGQLAPGAPLSQCPLDDKGDLHIWPPLGETALHVELTVDIDQRLVLEVDCARRYRG